MAKDANDNSQARPTEPPAGQPPEDRLEDLGRRVGRFIASAAARAREEAEDILAEAQSIKRGERE